MWLGFSFLVFIGAVGLSTLGIAVSMAVRPGERKLALFRPLSVSTLLAILSSVATGLGLALRRAADDPALAGGAETTRIMLRGFAEAMAPAVLGFAVLSVAWLLVALGSRRQV
jgi:hypothetical protein